jgi:phage baseplate assembly protein W
MTDFGKDTSCDSELRPGQLASGSRLVAEAVYRRLTTPRGSLIGSDEEAEYGLDLLDLIGSSVVDADVAAMPGLIRNEVLKDERVKSVTVTVKKSTLGPSISLLVSIDGETFDQDFQLTLLASDVTVQLLNISE